MGAFFPRKKHITGLLLTLVFSTSAIFFLVGSLSAQLSTQSLDSSTKTVNRTTAFPGETLRYNINVQNSDPVTMAMQITDTLPISVTLVEETLLTNVISGTTTGFGYESGVITWTGILSESGQAHISYSTTITDSLQQGDLIENVVQISDSNGTITRSTQTSIITSTQFFMPVIIYDVPQPSLFSIQRAGTSNDWALYWSDDAADITAYELQEASTSEFSDADTITLGDVQNYNVSQSPLSTDIYCYRVRALANGLTSEWSNSRCIQGNYFDNFNDANSGWSIRREDTDDVDNSSKYEDGKFILKIGGRWDYAIASPMVPAMETPYRIQTRVFFGGGVDNLHSYGLIFGGDYSGGACPNSSFSSCFNRYYRLNTFWYGPDKLLRFELKRIEGHSKNNNGGFGTALIPYRDVRVPNSQGYVTWAIDVYPNGTIDIFVEGNKVDSVNDGSYINSPYFGVFASANEYLGSEPTFEYFSVTSLSDN
jgi:uncharacterized repeat protein (TIGR01451 family)